MLVDEAHMGDMEYDKKEVETLPVDTFRERYGGIPFKKVLKVGNMYRSGVNEALTSRFNGMDEGLVKFLQFSPTAEYADGAVIFDREGHPVLELTMHAVRGFGVFYMGHDPHVSISDSIKRIYEDVEQGSVQHQD
jgi:hypothetical protein